MSSVPPLATLVPLPLLQGIPAQAASARQLTLLLQEVFAPLDFIDGKLRRAVGFMWSKKVVFHSRGESNAFQVGQEKRSFVAIRCSAQKVWLAKMCLNMRQVFESPWKSQPWCVTFSKRSMKVVSPNRVLGFATCPLFPAMAARSDSCHSRHWWRDPLRPGQNLYVQRWTGLVMQNQPQPRGLPWIRVRQECAKPLPWC